MKLLFTSLILLLPFIAYAQKPPKGTVLIVVKNRLLKEDNFYKVRRVLLENDYQIDGVDSTQTGIMSRRKKMPNWDATYNFFFLVKDSTIALYGKLTDPYMPRTLSKQIFLYIQNDGEFGSVTRESFKIMLDFSKKLGGNPYFVTDFSLITEIFEKGTSDDNNDDDIYFKPTKEKTSNEESIPL